MAMGHAYEDRLLPDRHALLFQMQAYATSEPEIRAYVREGYLSWSATWPSSRVSTEDETGTSSPTGCCSTCWRCWSIDWMPER